MLTRRSFLTSLLGIGVGSLIPVTLPIPKSKVLHLYKPLEIRGGSGIIDGYTFISHMPDEQPMLRFPDWTAQGHWIITNCRFITGNTFCYY